MAVSLSTGSSSFTAFLKSGWGTLTALKSSQSVVISSIAQIVFNKFIFAGLLVGGGVIIYKLFGKESVENAWTQGKALWTMEMKYVKTAFKAAAIGLVVFSLLGGAAFTVFAL